MGEQVNQTADIVFKYSPQMFYIENRKDPIRPIALATCVLYENNNAYFLITASHVFEDENIPLSNIGILINDEYSLLCGKLVFTNSNKNKIDLAIMKLYDYFAKDIMNEYTFLKNENIDTSHKLTNKLEYLMAGFPVTKTKIKHYNKTIKREQFVLMTKNSDYEKYKKLNFSLNEHIMVDISNTRDFKNITTKSAIPQLHGVSGSGLWHLKSPSYSNYKLIAIMIAGQKEDNLAIGTKIYIAIDMIQYYLSENITNHWKKNKAIIRKYRPFKYRKKIFERLNYKDVK